MGPRVLAPSSHNVWLRRFSKLTCGSTLCLIFVGGLVTSTGSGLAVPDWPLSYGMLFPPMVGGVFYEHGHRMVASVVGLFMLILAIWMAITEKRVWVKNFGFTALGAVIVQGILGGITVKFFLPAPVSIAHGILAQTFFVLTIIIAYSLSYERTQRLASHEETRPENFMQLCFFLIIVIYAQLFLGAVMRHTHSGLAIPDFPTMGGQYLPRFDQTVLEAINGWRFRQNLDPVTLGQIKIHFAHRLGALTILMVIVYLTWIVLKYYPHDRLILNTVYMIDSFIVLQILLGVLTVLSVKSPLVTSIHVVTGAAVLGLSVLLALRSCPLTMNGFKKAFKS